MHYYISLKAKVSSTFEYTQVFRDASQGITFDTKKCVQGLQGHFQNRPQDIQIKAFLYP